MRLSQCSPLLARTRRIVVALALILAALLPLVPAAHAATFTIACGDTAGIVVAITIANANNQPDTINLAANCIYQVSVPDNLPNAFPVIGVDGVAANTLTINGNGATIERVGSESDFRFFQVAGSESDDATLILNDLTLRNGSLGEGSGGAIAVEDTQLALNQVTLTNNSATEGGAVSGVFSQITISNSTFSNNSANEGGALNGYYSALAIESSAFSANNATDPGFSGGGAILALSPNGSITSSTFSGNLSASDGGAIHFTNDGGGELEILNSTISGNSAANAGGGIANAIALSLNSSTITGNTADSDGDSEGDGGGISGFVTMNSSIIAGNFDTPGNGGASSNLPDIDSGPGSSGYNIIGTLGTTDFAFNTTGDRYGDPNGTTTPDPGAFEAAAPIDPLLGSLAANGGPTQTHALLTGSPAIDNGDTKACPATDQRGIARPAGPACDIGAFEAPAIVLAPEIVVFDDADTSIPNGGTFIADFGSTPAGTAVTRSFTIQNTGTAALTLSNLFLPRGFSVVGTFPISITANSSATFQIRFSETQPGTYGGVVSFNTNDADENPFSFQIIGIITAAPPPPPPPTTFKVFLPLVFREGKADLTITSLTLSPNKQSYMAGEAVVATVVVKNNGSAPTTPFWVDLYVNPARVPQTNDLWHNICGIMPCVGTTWAVVRSLAPGESITLTTTVGYDQARSYWLGWLPSGTTTLYALVDSWNITGTTGAVDESDESNNRAQVNDLTVTGSNPAYTPWQPSIRDSQMSILPARPVR